MEKCAQFVIQSLKKNYKPIQQSHNQRIRKRVREMKRIVRKFVAKIVNPIHKINNESSRNPQNLSARRVKDRGLLP